MSEDFDWNDLKSFERPIRCAFETAVYPNANGDVVIRQRDADGEESMIFIPNDRLKEFIKALRLTQLRVTEE